MYPTDALTESATRERGFLDTLSPASPAAGANYSFTVGGLNVDYLRVIACQATLTTDANVANRVFSLDFRGARSGTAIRNSPGAVYTANTAATAFQWDQAHTFSDFAANTIVFVPLVNVYLTPGWSVQLTVDNIQTGDTITAITFTLEKFYGDTG